MTAEQKTAFAKAWDEWRAKCPSYLDQSTLTPGPYLENRLFTAFSDGWNAATIECMKLLQVKL